MMHARANRTAELHVARGCLAAVGDRRRTRTSLIRIASILLAMAVWWPFARRYEQARLAASSASASVSNPEIHR